MYYLSIKVVCVCARACVCVRERVCNTMPNVCKGTCGKVVLSVRKIVLTNEYIDVFAK